jgi:hypothetical protein
LVTLKVQIKARSLSLSPNQSNHVNVKNPSLHCNDHISAIIASVVPPFHLHPVANDSAHQPTRGDHQTRPRFANALAIFTAAARGDISAMTTPLLQPSNADDAAFLPLFAFE